MDFFHICFMILAAQISIFSIKCVEINSFVNNDQKEIDSTPSKIANSNEYKLNKLNSPKEKDSLNIRNHEQRSNTSKSQFNRTRSISVQPQNVTFTFLLSKLMRMKRELLKRRLHNKSVYRIKDAQHSTNIDPRTDVGTEEAINIPESQGATEANPVSESNYNTVNHEANSKTDELNKNEENGTTTTTITETSVDAEEEGEVSLQEIERDQAKLDFLIEKVKKLLADSGDYIMSVLLRILKEHLRKYNFGSQFMEKVKEMAKQYQGNVLKAKQVLEKKLGKKFGKKFRLMLIKLLRTLVAGGSLRQ